MNAVERRVRPALSELRRHQKTSKGAPAYSLLVNRPLGRLFAALAYRAGLVPDHVTLLSAACTYAAIALLATVSPSPIAAIGVCSLLVVGYALDAADGQLARLRGGGSIAGEWLDHVVDAGKIATMHLAVLIGWYRFTDRDDVELLIPIGFAAVASVLFFVIILNDRIRRAQRGTTDMLLAGDGSSSRLYSVAVMPTDYGLLCVSFVLWGWPRTFTVVYGLLFAAHVAFLVLASVKWFREMRSYDAARRYST